MLTEGKHCRINKADRLVLLPQEEARQCVSVCDSEGRSRVTASQHQAALGCCGDSRLCPVPQHQQPPPSGLPCLPGPSVWFTVCLRTFPSVVAQVPGSASILHIYPECFPKCPLLSPCTGATALATRTLRPAEGLPPSLVGPTFHVCACFTQCTAGLCRHGGHG